MLKIAFPARDQSGKASARDRDISDPLARNRLAQLRASATDSADALPAHAVAKRLGHSPLVAAKHYLQTRDAYFELVTNGLASKHSNLQTIRP
jgi:hypothetical protein